MIENTFPPELVRSLSRMIYGHETWLENPRRENGKIIIDGMYGHRLENDRAMPLCYANISIFNDKGYSDVEYELYEEDNCRRLRFDDDGSDIITVYYDSVNIPWIQNDDGWAMGVKRDFSNVKYAAAFNLIAKRIISKDGNPGNVVNSTLEVMPSTVAPKVGETVKVQILYEGNPLPNMKALVYRRGAEDFIKYTTDSDGRFEFDIDEPGMWTIIAKHADPSKCVEDEYDEAVYEATLTMETA
ncbi:MAG: DUF4198 domain-containing protein [Candidatus Methanomethylophilaceae archaeon]